MSQVIVSKEQITSSWLGDVLGHPIQSIHIEEVVGGYGGKFRIQAVRLDNSTYHLFLKLSDHPHEACFYQAMHNQQTPIPIVPCYDVQIDDDQAHILLKDLSNTHEARPPSQMPPLLHECEAIIDGLVDLHAYWWDSPELSTTFGGVPSDDSLRENLTEEVNLYPAFAEFMRDRLSPTRRRVYETVIPQLPEMMIHRFAQGNLTLVFEDVHTGNFLYPRNSDDRLYFVDWEQWSINIPMNDLAYMMALFWSPERRSRYEIPFLKRYHERLQAQGIDYAWDSLWDDYRLCAIYFLFRPIWQWKHNHFTDVWWNHFERIMIAYEELNCEALLA